MQVLRELLRLAGKPLALVSMVFLLAFSVGYSIFIGAMASGGSTEAAIRFAYLNFLFGILSALFGAIILYVLARRLGDTDKLGAPRIAAFVGVTVALFLFGRLVQAVWPLVFFSLFSPDDLYVMAMLLPSVALRILLFPIVVWQVGLARGHRERRLGDVWRRIWGDQRYLVVIVAGLAIASAVLQQLTQPLVDASSSLKQVMTLAVAIGPSAVASILHMLMAIIAHETVANTDPRQQAEVFS